MTHPVIQGSLARTFSHLRHNQRGLTLVELAIALTIAGLVIAALWVAASTAIDSRKMVETESDLSELILDIREYYSGRALPTGTAANINTQLINADAVPAGLVKGTSLRHAFDASSSGSSVNVFAPCNVSGAYQLSLSRLNEQQCARLLARLSTTGNTQDLGIIGANAGQTSPTGSQCGTVTDITPAQAVSLCAATGNVINFTVQFRQ